MLNLRPPMDLSVQAVRNKTTRVVEGAQLRNDLFLQDVAQARDVFARLESQGRTLTSEEVRVCRKSCRGCCCCCCSCSFQSLLWYRRSFFLATPQRYQTECLTVDVCTYAVLPLLHTLTIILLLIMSASVDRLSSLHP